MTKYRLVSEPRTVLIAAMNDKSPALYSTIESQGLGLRCMKKRLRKKNYVGEFTEWGAPITIVRTCTDDFDRFLDDFLDQAIEANACSFGGVGKDDRLEGVIELGKASDRPEERLQRVFEWLASREDVQEYAGGKIFDVWHGPFHEMDSR